MDFNFKIEQKKDFCVLYFAGNLIEKSQAIEMLENFNGLLSKGVNRFLINMTDFGYMNSTGLNVLINILTKARKQGGEAIICSVPENIKSLMLVTKLNKIFTVLDNETEAEKLIIKEAL